MKEYIYILLVDLLFKRLIMLNGNEKWCEKPATIFLFPPWTTRSSLNLVKQLNYMSSDYQLYTVGLLGEQNG